MCIKNFIGEKIIFDKFTAFFNLDIFQPSLIYNTAGRAYFMKSSPPSAFIMSPQPKVGDILFLVRFPSASASASASPRPRSFFLTRYLLNQWMDFDQTCIDTWLGGGKELIRFW